jgi:hexosaminidase
MTHAYRVEASFLPLDGVHGRMTFTLFNLSDTPLSDFTFSYTSLTRIADENTCDNATLLRRVANLHDLAPPKGLTIAPGGHWQFSVTGLTRPAKHCTDGVKSAYLSLKDGRHVTVSFGDLMLEGRTSTRPAERLAAGALKEPYSLLPWPNDLSLVAGASVPVALYPAAGSQVRFVRAVAEQLGLFQRLMPSAHVPFSLVAVAAGLPIVFVDAPDMSAEAYRLTFAADGIALASGSASGLQFGLTSLAQMLHGARSKPDMFRFPASGTIDDAPRYAWRGCHLDVARQFYPMEQVLRLIDICAWNKLNVFHWHLTEDEAWRLEIKAFPTLTTIGQRRGPDEVLVPQLGNSAEICEGFYSQDDVRKVVAHAMALNIDVVPEIDIPGHSTAALLTLPELTDGQEAPESYRSVQGYHNNSLNPAVAFTYDFLEAVFDEMVTLFPSAYIHIGGDEVPDGSWLASPLCRALMEKEGLKGTFELQSYFLGKVKAMLDRRGKKLAGWDEVSHGGGVSAQGTLLMAWQKPEVGIHLAEQGYDVVMTPGQAYYLDMVQDEAWQEPGASWAGTSTCHHSYSYEAEGAFPEALKPKMRGIQACIWSEHFISKDYFNHLVFPRLPGIAEAGWTHKANKDWDRFSAIVRLTPVL